MWGPWHTGSHSLTQSFLHLLMEHFSHIVYSSTTIHITVKTLLYILSTRMYCIKFLLIKWNGKLLSKIGLKKWKGKNAVKKVSCKMTPKNGWNWNCLKFLAMKGHIWIVAFYCIFNWCVWNAHLFDFAFACWCLSFCGQKNIYVIYYFILILF